MFSLFYTMDRLLLCDLLDSIIRDYNGFFKFCAGIGDILFVLLILYVIYAVFSGIVALVKAGIKHYKVSDSVIPDTFNIPDEKTENANCSKESAESITPADSVKDAIFCGCLTLSIIVIIFIIYSNLFSY